MSLSLDHAACFLRGHFNPRIVNPDWLAQQGIWSSDGVALGLGILRDGLSFRDKSVEWLVDNQGLVLSSLDADCGDLAAQVLELLPHTPMTAVGNNFNFVCDRDDWGDRPLPQLGGQTNVSVEGLETTESHWCGVFERDELRVQVTLISRSDVISVSINNHRKTPDAEKGALAARQFEADKTSTASLVQSLFGVEVY